MPDRDRNGIVGISIPLFAGSRSIGISGGVRGGAGDDPTYSIACPPKQAKSKSLSDQRQDYLRNLVGLRKHRGACLHDDLVPAEPYHFRGHVGVADVAFGC